MTFDKDNLLASLGFLEVRAKANLYPECHLVSLIRPLIEEVARLREIVDAKSEHRRMIRCEHCKGKGCEPPGYYPQTYCTVCKGEREVEA